MRIDYDDLPEPVRMDMKSRFGVIRTARTVEAGTNCDIAAVLETDSAGRVFLKGLPEDHDSVRDQQREARVNPYIEEIGPRLLGSWSIAGWDLIAFDAVEDARHADYTPGSPDLPKLATVMKQLAETPCPSVPMMTAGRRWGAYLDNTEGVALLEGSSLLHTDYHGGNVLITNERAWLVDWAWATRGAAFIDLALLLPRLIAAGHSPDQAEAWAAKHTVWQDANPAAITAFAAAISRLWGQLAERHADRKARQPIVDAAIIWADHRGTTA
ncbi:phosphotransferase [Actinospica sp. MGRD01-02]|uniref:Phosphotransferase n=1 Tax=Actinospica acidithermotolerans TaxID=2828514 RepID=A0A941EBJ3_9ACTN|nr:phosphotransferase [Actinospica acidithermotolerans]MBR7827573.1 phosphotransferase [Actinospica acidithermotolerans]